MNTVQVRNITIGKGKPKICVPIVGKTGEEIEQEAEKICKIPADIVEWRVDFFQKAFEVEAVISEAQKLRFILENRPLLVTFRTANEGGEKEIEWNTYASMLEKVAASGYVDLIDVEAFFSENKSETEDLIERLQINGVKIIASNHHFFETPSKESMLELLKEMQNMGADIAKLAVMPKKKEDVISLLEATLEMTQQHANRPIITMSMGKEGMVSRLCGTLTGSAVTFGAVEKASAPGQWNVTELAKILEILQ